LQFHVDDVRQDLEAAKNLAEGLKKINCNVALDHYPRDGDATALLDALPLDAVRLSPDFMADLASNNKRQARLDEVNKMLQGRGLNTVATAVEDANGLAVLWNTGVNYIQGYFLQEPSNSITYEYDG
jgi:EAL domain-containing protein (putative c-di-GMP-specific phosphodiesterase class I)